MCGISGIIAKNKVPVDSDTLNVMNNCILHRGPDGGGFYTNGSVGFGHRRLSILDLSDLGAQPMHYTDRLTITYNGEVYNYVEIRETLRSKGYTFISGSDTEVILAAYLEWGTECVHQFNGMWAFAIHDKLKNQVFVSRDRFGVKPLYYYETSENFFFSSEIRQLLTQVKERKAEKQILFDYLFLGYHHHTAKTFFENILSLDPGHNILIDLETNTYTISQWYFLEVNKEITNLPFDSAQRLFEDTINSSIQLRLRSDVKVGTCLSGGLDSSYIAAVASDIYHKQASEKFTAITAKSFEKQNDESHFAQMVADASNLDWKVNQPEKEDFLRVMEDVIETQEEPFGSPSVIMQYFVMQSAKEAGCIVLLDGQGGDEGLLGYDRYFAAYINQQPGLLKKIKSFWDISRNSKLSLIDLFLYVLYFNSSSIRAKRQLLRSSYIKSAFKKFLNKDLLAQISTASRNIEDLQKLEITKVQLQKLLKYEDRNSMRFSIETRVPFVDYRVIELAISLPFQYKVKDGWSKYILRKTAERRLPKEIVWRKIKLGFEAPKNWFGDKTMLMSEITESHFLGNIIDKTRLSGKIDNDTLWRLYNVAVWARKFNVQQIDL